MGHEQLSLSVSRINIKKLFPRPVFASPEQIAIPKTVSDENRGTLLFLGFRSRLLSTPDSG